MSDAPVPLIQHQTNCYACGPENAASMGLEYHAVGDRIRARMHLTRVHEGAPGFVHGGALAAILDDTLGTLLVLLRTPAVTARLEVDFRRPAFVERDFTAEAWTDRIEGRKLFLEGVVRDHEGQVVAEGHALFLTVDLSHFAQAGSDMPQRIKDRWARPEAPDLPY